MLVSLIWAVIAFCIICVLDTGKLKKRRYRRKKNREFGRKYNIRLKEVK